MKLPCAVCRDLLPLYVENMVEAETKSLMDQHLASCPDCQQKLTELHTEPSQPVETAQPLQALKKQLRWRRWHTALVAALFVFVVLCTFFYRQTALQPVPWQEGMMQAKGIETRPKGALQGAPKDAESDTVDVLVLRFDSRINSLQQSAFQDEDGSRTVLLQGWTSQATPSATKDYSEITLYPVPDRVLYQADDQQTLLWGEPMNGGVEVLPRLALGFYVVASAVLAAIFGLVWFLLRHHSKSWIARQVFFAPLAYLAAHGLLLGLRTTTFFMLRDFAFILLMAAAVYALLSLLWQGLLQRRREA